MVNATRRGEDRRALNQRFLAALRIASKPTLPVSWRIYLTVALGEKPAIGLGKFLLIALLCF